MLVPSKETFRKLLAFASEQGSFDGMAARTAYGSLILDFVAAFGMAFERWKSKGSVNGQGERMKNKERKWPRFLCLWEQVR